MQSLNIKQIDAQLKRTNWRISDIAKRYGTDSATYRKATAFLFDDTESKNNNGKVTITRKVKKEYENITHFVTTKEGITYITIDRTKSAKERFKKSLENPNSDNLAKMYNQARNVKTQGQLERQLLGDRYNELQEMRENKEITKEEYKRLAEKEIELVYKISEDFQTQLNEIYEHFTDSEIKKKVPELYKTGRKTYSELEEISRKLRTLQDNNENKENLETRLPLGG